MRRTLLKVITFLVCIGVVAIAINTIFGNETITYIQKTRIEMTNNQHFYMWKFNFWQYIQNVQLAITDVSEFTLNLPTRQFSNDIPNNIALVIDYIIVVINVLLYPLRIGAYLLNNLLAILGVSTDMESNKNGLKWLYVFVNKVIGIEIPYI